MQNIFLFCTFNSMLKLVSVYTHTHTHIYYLIHYFQWISIFELTFSLFQTVFYFAYQPAQIQNWAVMTFKTISRIKSALKANRTWLNYEALCGQAVKTHQITLWFLLWRFQSCQRVHIFFFFLFLTVQAGRQNTAWYKQSVYSNTGVH